jgi:DNA-binding CsgD family transcriptional regulator
MNSLRAEKNGKAPTGLTLGLEPPDGWGQPMIVSIDVNDANLYDLVLSVLTQVGARLTTGPPTHVLTDKVEYAHKRRDDATHVFVISENVRVAQLCFGAVTAGHAQGIVNTIAIARLPAVLAAAASGFACVPSNLIERISTTPTLTERQYRVLEGVSAGLTNQTIAWRCGVSVSTVKREIAEVLRALGVASRTQLATKAVELGLVQLGGLVGSQE